MIVGTGRIVLGLPGNSSLKGKRKVARKILDRAKHRFNAAISEVDSLEEHRRLTLGVAVVSNDHGHATSMLDTVMEFLATAGDAVPMDRRTEIVNLGRGVHMETDDGFDRGW
ncbi:MAG: DUF503 domain-containing protein [Sandaracinaceae bacterium]